MRVLFQVEQDYYWTGFEPIYRAMKRQGGWDLWLRLGANQKRVLGWLVSQKKTLQQSYRQRGFQVTDSPDGFNVVICGSVLKNPEQYGSALLCNVDHGPGLKTLRYREFAKQPHIGYHVFVEGRYRIQCFHRYGLKQQLYLYDVGLPKLDPFFDGSFDRKSILASLKLDASRSTILYAPSYKPTSIFQLADYLPALSQHYNLIIKLHPYSWNGKYASHRQHRIFEKMLTKHTTIRLIGKNDHNMMPYMFVADSMISEGSSVINEFLALGRCGVIFDLDEDKMKHSDGQSWLADSARSWLKDSFVHIDDPKLLSQAVAEALRPPPGRLAQLAKDRDYVFSYYDGLSSQRVCRKIGDLLADSSSSP